MLHANKVVKEYTKRWLRIKPCIAIQLRIVQNNKAKVLAISKQ